MSLRLDFDTSVASVLIEICNNKSNVKQSPEANVCFHSELLENLMKKGQFSEYCLNENKRVKDEALSELNKKSRFLNTAYKEPRPLAIASLDQMAIFLSKSLSLIRFKKRPSLEYNSNNIMKLDNAIFPINHKTMKPSELGRIINTTIENPKADVCRIKKLKQPRLYNEVLDGTAHHRKPKRVESFSIKFRNIQLLTPDSVLSPPLGNTRKLGILARLCRKSKAMCPLKTDDASCVVDGQTILSKEHKLLLTQSTMRTSCRVEGVAKRQDASMEFFHNVFDLEWKTKDMLLKKRLLKTLDAIEGVTVYLTQSNNSTVEVNGVPKFVTNSLNLRNTISCNITIQLCGYKHLIVTSVPLTLINTILQKCSDLRSASFEKYSFTGQNGAYNRKERLLAIDAEPGVQRLMASLGLLQVGSTNPFHRENVAVDGSVYKQALVGADIRDLSDRMSRSVNRHFMCDCSMNGDMTRFVLSTRCLPYRNTEFLHSRSATDDFVNSPEIWHSVFEPVPYFVARARVEVVNNVETDIVSKIKIHRHANWKATWNDQVDNNDTWRNQMDYEIESREGFDARQYDFFANNSKENEDVEFNQKSEINKEVATNRGNNIKNYGKHYGLLGNPIQLDWSIGKSDPLDDYVRKEDRTDKVFVQGFMHSLRTQIQKIRTMKMDLHAEKMKMIVLKIILFLT